MKILEGKNIVVTGTRRGMGKQMVLKFAEQGANVFAHARKYDEEHEKFCKEVASKYNVKILPLYFDLTDHIAVKDAVKIIRGCKIPINGLVNNAGIIYNALFQMTNFEELRKLMEVNFFAPFFLTQYISKLMIKEKSGSIVTISSVAALDGNSGKSAYGASKAALIPMTLAISEELAATGIRANVICPGAVNTEMLDIMSAQIIDIQRKATFLGKLGEPNDIANTAMWLLSDYSSYVTGQVIRVDGGLTSYDKRY